MIIVIFNLQTTHLIKTIGYKDDDFEEVRIHESLSYYKTNLNPIQFKSAANISFNTFRC